VSLGLAEGPGAYGADVAVAEGAGLGTGTFFGGPHLGVFATRWEHVRKMPGRIVGETVDAKGERAYCLTFSTREQHIRRDKATSNICTNSGLCALAFTIHMSLLGEAGLRRLALLNHQAARRLRESLNEVKGVKIMTPRFFNEFAFRLPIPAAEAVEALAARGVLGGVPYSRLNPGAGMDDVLLVAATETTTLTDIETFRFELRELLA
jgi:glycine dehydrogenase subunit 1